MLKSTEHEIHPRHHSSVTLIPSHSGVAVTTVRLLNVLIFPRHHHPPPSLSGTLPALNTESPSPPSDPVTTTLSSISVSQATLGNSWERSCVTSDLRHLPHFTDQNASQLPPGCSLCLLGSVCTGEGAAAQACPRSLQPFSVAPTEAAESLGARIIRPVVSCSPTTTRAWTCSLDGTRDMHYRRLVLQKPRGPRVRILE